MTPRPASVPNRRSSGALVTAAAMIVGSLLVLPAAAGAGGANEHGGGHGTTTSSTSTTTSSTTTTTSTTASSTTSTTVPTIVTVPDDPRRVENMCVGTFGCTLRSHGGTVTWVGVGSGGSGFDLVLVRDGETIAASSERTGSFDTIAGDAVIARASSCLVLPPVGVCRGFPYPPLGGFVAIVNP